MNYWFQILKNSKSLAFLIIITFLITLMGLLSPIFIIHIFNRYIAFGLQGTLMFLLLACFAAISVDSAANEDNAGVIPLK